MIAAARKSLGMSGRPNTITREYASRHGDEFLRASWCDMAITYWARHSGNASAVLPGGDRAYTVWHATDFQKAGRWHSGTAASVDKAKPGDIVFFDWGGTDDVDAIDHVGVVEKVLGGGRLQTIEANTSDAVRRRVRDSGVIAGYGRPNYEEEDDMPTPRDLWTWDGIEAPTDDETGKYLNPKNEHWRPDSYLRESYLFIRRIHKLVGQLAARDAADVDEDAIAAAVLAGLQPEKIAAAIPDEIAEQVVAALGARLSASEKT
jgi:hypothetical protein